MTAHTELYPLKLYLTKRATLVILILSVFVNLATWSYLAWNIRPQEVQLFLHYNILFGVDAHGDWTQVFMLPAAGLVVLLTNTTLGWLLYGRDRFAAGLLNSTGLLVQLTIFVAAALLVFLNT